MEEIKPLFGSFKGISTGIGVQWAIIILVTLIAWLLTRNLNKMPDKKQSAVEIVVESINNLVKENMGESYKSFIPYVGTLAIFILLMNLAGLVGAPVPTEDVSVTAGLAAITFFMIQATSIKRNGLVNYFTAFGKPKLFLLPINILERFTTPLSLCLRLFGNMTAGGVLLSLIYKGMGHFAFVLPVPFHFYFDVFDGGLQMLIFVMLTMINIKITAEE
ncbi:MULTISPECIES: F0F1 ATP synthase subunit A [Clostridium]|uniref:F0F1 ATP synthase subunit A n=1 Tax=Clostridium TaxID=1485 RepID=UPI00069D1521|nr:MULTISPECIES: F0F1 ATP synthase subunit A [Clostridium]KOF57220.1 ATP synthase F0F1 subunit A [Clostridium sp. DMHC 10]MCD2346995.1 F0F1 ATP synthase subunit A [Clostridium guangxiense]